MGQKSSKAARPRAEPTRSPGPNEASQPSNAPATTPATRAAIVAPRQHADNHHAGDDRQNDRRGGAEVAFVEPVPVGREEPGHDQPDAESDQERRERTTPAQIDDGEHEQHDCGYEQLRAVEQAPSDRAEDRFAEEKQQPYDDQDSGHEEKQESDSAQRRRALALIRDL